MADKDDFHFEEEGEESSFDMTGGVDGPGLHGDEGLDSMDSSFVQTKKRSLSRPLLLVLLLLVLCLAAGYYYLNLTPAPEVKAPVPVAKKQAIPLPVMPSPPPPGPAPAESGTTVAPSPVPAPVTRPLEKGVVEETLSQKEVAVVEPAVAPRSEPVANPSPKSEAKTEARPAMKPVPEPAAVAASAPVSPTGKYILQGGAFLVHDNLSEAEKTIRALGFEPRLEPGTKTAKMTRLRVGLYSPENARSKILEVRALAPDAFLARAGGQVGVYVGSFYDLDKARRFADTLYQKGLRVEEEYVEVSLPLTILTFGDFPDMSTARQAAERARAKGLDVLIVQRH